MKRTLDHLDLCLEYSRKNQFDACQTHERGQQWHDDVRSQIRADEIGGRCRLIYRSDVKVDLVQNVVGLRILTRNCSREFVAVECLDARFRIELRRRNRENARARSNVEKTTTREVFLHRIETEPSGLVSARAEGHSRLDANDDAIACIAEPGPGRRNYEPANLDRLPALFPLLEPITRLDFAQVHVAH